MVAQAHRSGTQGVYSSHWSRWLRWSQDNQVDPHNPSRIQVANFLAYLSTDLSLSASSIKVHRAAICTTLRQLGGPSLSDDPLLRDLVRSASIRDARNPRRTPSWDLFLVLSALCLAPYEPIREISLKFLTLKTVFLVALASGRRCSKVHALSGLPSDVASELDGFFSLRFLPKFLAKKQSPGDPFPVIHIKHLTSILCPDDKDCSLCPVRALRIYWRRTSALCATCHRLFISWNEGYAQDIRHSSVSRWLAQVISAANARSGSYLPGVVPRPHEVRAWASSLVFALSRSPRDIMEAAYWCLQATFIQFYLRDVSCLQDDGSHGVVSAVVAQQAVSSRSSRAATPRTGRRSRAATSRT